MDTNKLTQRIRARFDHYSARLYLEEKYDNQLLIVAQGGTWIISPDFLTFLRTSPQTTIALDSNHRPVQINTRELLAQAQDTYDNIMGQWLEEFEELERKR
jgi:hypothetical protein